MNDLELGQIVRSSAGRDKGGWMVVVAKTDDLHVAVCDGKNRKVSAPKKKKIKHLNKTNTVDQGVHDKLTDGMKISNAEIRRALEAFNKVENPEE